MESTPSSSPSPSPSLSPSASKRREAERRLHREFFERQIAERRRAQIFRLLGAISIAILLMAYVWQFDDDESLRRPPPSTHEDPLAASLSKLGQQRQQFVNTNFGERVYNARPHGRFWRELHSLLDASKPTLRYPIKTLLSEGGDSKLQYRPKEEQQSPLPQNLEIEDDDLETLRLQHEKFLRLLDEDAPRLAYRPRTNGIVMTVNKEMVPSLLTTLHMLRLTGTQLPVEVFLGDDRDYDEFVCEETLPLLNAKCIRMSQVFKKSPLETKLIGFQFKIFSILFSSFQNVMFLDVDNIPLRSLDKLPSSKAFKQKGLLIWPAYYKSTASPAFFDLSNQTIPQSMDVPAAESGQLLVSKKTHKKALLLAAYYNFYGPNIYYSLLCQGEPGEGDKDTYLPAVKLLGLPYQLITTGPRPWSYTLPDGQHNWHGALLQADPVWDYNLPPTQKFGFSWPGRPHAPANAYMFLHSMQPKLDPAVVLGKYGLAWNNFGKPRRMWAPLGDVIRAVGYDVEALVWRALRETACTLEKTGWKQWEKEESLCGLFKNVTELVGFAEDMDLGAWAMDG